MDSAIISDFSIQTDDSSNYTYEFPEFLNISFKEFDKQFHVQFAKAVKINVERPPSNDIYVIDRSTKEPVKYEQKKETVY